MLPLEHSAIFFTCIKRLSVLKTIFGVRFEWQLKTGFTVEVFPIEFVSSLSLPIYCKKHLSFMASIFSVFKRLTYWGSLILGFLAHLSQRLKVSYCDRSSSLVHLSVHKLFL